MRFPLFLSAIALLFSGSGTAVEACIVSVPLHIEDVRHADVVVVGRITDYRLVLDPVVRARRKADVARNPEVWKRFGDQTRFLPDHARFRIEVEEVLYGEAPDMLVATWDNSTFAEPDSLAPGPYVIALRNPQSGTPPLRGPSAVVGPAPEPGTLTLLQAPCARPFLFEADSEKARLLRDEVKRLRRP